MEARIPPQATDIEEAVLGAMLIEQECVDEVMSTLSESDFYKPAHQKVFSVFQELYSSGEAIDALTAENSLKDREGVEGVDLIALTSAVGSAANIAYYCQIIREKAMRRNLIAKCTEVISKSYDQSTDTMEVMDFAQESVFSASEGKSGSLRDMAEVMSRIVHDIHQIQENGRPMGLRTGLDIDSILSGFQGSKLYILGARPSMGKTALAMTILRRLAKDGHSAGIISLETSDKSLGIRLISQVANIQTDVITSGGMTGEQMERVSDAMSELSSYGILIDDEASVNVQKLRSKCRMMVSKGAELIFVDFLQLLQSKGRSKHEEIGMITKALKQISKELDIPVIALSQLSRKVEERQDKRPMMSDLRESGSIEEDADVILFLYRPEYYGVTTTAEGQSTKGLCDVIIAKNKDGKTGVKSLRFIPEYTRFENIAYQHQEPVQSWYEPQNSRNENIAPF